MLHCSVGQACIPVDASFGMLCLPLLCYLPMLVHAGQPEDERSTYVAKGSKGWDLAAATRATWIRDYDQALTIHSFGRPSQMSQGVAFLWLWLHNQPVHEVALRLPLAAAGWKTVDAYYQGSSSSDLVPNINIPLLCLQVSCRAPCCDLVFCMSALADILPCSLMFAGAGRSHRACSGHTCCSAAAQPQLHTGGHPSRRASGLD
jgi:hypothetical protein